MADTVVREKNAGLSDWLRLLRPQHWVKNFFVLAPLLFSGLVVELPSVSAALRAFVSFCLLSSSIYVWNDIADREADRAHPDKRLRPIAAGTIRPQPASVVSLLLLVAGLAIGWSVNPAVLGTGVLYAVLNIVYTLVLKRYVILDVFTISALFLIRLVAGSWAVGVFPSIWLLLCGGLLALYLGFTKRRRELLTLGSDSAQHRSVLVHYSPIFLDQMAVVLLSVTIVSYIMYTLVSETALQAGSNILVYSTIFVLYGVFRYLYLVHEKEGGNPTETLLTDGGLMLTVLLWLAYCGWALYRPF
jgi:4-hydroxybenzoate polyprenyltransferase